MLLGGSWLQNSLSAQNHIIRSNLKNTIKYVKNTIRRIIRLRRMTHPCIIDIGKISSVKLNGILSFNRFVLNTTHLLVQNGRQTAHELTHVHNHPNSRCCSLRAQHATSRTRQLILRRAGDRYLLSTCTASHQLNASAQPVDVNEVCMNCLHSMPPTECVCVCQLILRAGDRYLFSTCTASHQLNASAQPVDVN